MKRVIGWLGIYLSICYAISMYSPIASPKPDTCASAFEAQYLTVKHVDGHSLFWSKQAFPALLVQSCKLSKESIPSITDAEIYPFYAILITRGIVSIIGRCIFWSLGRHQRNICGKYSDLIHPHTYTWFGMMWCFPSYHSILPSYWWIVAWETPCIYF